MNLSTKSVVLMGLALATTLGASNALAASVPASRGVTTGQPSYTVQYRNRRSQSRSFASLREALRFQAQMRRAGYSTSITRSGREYVVKYRQLRFRQRTFTGRDAARQARAFVAKLRRMGYEARYSVGAGGGAVRPGNFNPQHLVGQSEERAIALARKNGLTVRVVSRDGRSFAGTRDYRTDRVNLSIVRGRVVRATIG